MENPEAALSDGFETDSLSPIEEFEAQVKERACAFFRDKKLTEESFTKNLLASCEVVGSHMLKTVNPRASGAIRARGARPEDFSISCPAMLMPYAVFLIQRCEIEGFEIRRLIDHLLDPDENSPEILDIFERHYGVAPLEAARTAMQPPLSDVSRLHDENFPIIFVPSPGGGDLQVTPISPVMSARHMRDATGPYFLKQKKAKDAPRVPRGRWMRVAFSSKPQNVSPDAIPSRQTFLAEMPKVLNVQEAELYRYIHGGSFPQMRDPEIVDMVKDYSKALKVEQEYSNRDIRRGIDWRADGLIILAQEFVSDIIAVATNLAKKDPDLAQRSFHAPSLTSVLMRRWWGEDSARKNAQAALASAHFKKRLRAANEGEMKS